MIKLKKEPILTIWNWSNYLFNADNLVFLNEYIDQLEWKIDIISIDPPYNTWKKMWKYKDSFWSISEWQNFLHPRLLLAKKYLSENWVILININDINSPYLRILCDDIFWIKNFISTIVWQNKYTVSNDKHWITTQTENILVYAKNKSKLVINNDPLRDEYVNKTYKNWDNDSRWLWRKGVQLWKKKTTKTYTVTSSTWKQWTKWWNYSETEWYNELVKKDLLYWWDDWNSCPTKKVFLKNTKGVGVKNLWLGEEVWYTQDWTKDLENAIKIEASFLYPKPVKLIQRILKIVWQKNSIIMDFFAGSWTVWESVIKYNENNNTNMKFILVTNNENNICSDITLKRVSKFANDKNWGLTYVEL